MHAPVENIQGTLPKALVPVLFAVADDAAVDLVDLLEPAVLHQRAQDFAANAARAIRDHRLVLQVVVLAGFDLPDEVVSGAHIRHDGVFELADLRLHGVAPVEEDNLVAALLYQLVHFLRLQVHAAADHAVFVHLQLVRGAEGHDLVTHLHGQAREVVRRARGPLEFHLLEAGEFAGTAHVLLAAGQRAADGAVDAVLADEDAPLQLQLFA